MNTDYEEQLKNLDDLWNQGQLPEPEYKERKWGLLQGACNDGVLLSQDYFFAENQEITDKNGVEFCYVGMGPFVFGPEDEYCELKAPIYIAKHPVTVQQFTTFVEESGYDFPEEDLETMNLVSPSPDCPVSHVSWNDAKEYCRWLRKINNEYYSLPHEIEWERAARGIDGRFLPWGNEDPTEDLACFREPIVHSSTRPIHAYPENISPNGCMGMVGNVWEWCLDSVKDERDPHILRGGSWCNPVDYSNCVSRTFAFPATKRIDYGGFRVVYLPNDMLVEYRRQYAGGVTSKQDLTVVTQGKRKKKGKSTAPDVAAKVASAPAAQASGDSSDSALNDLMAEAISEAAALYRSSLEKPEAAAPEATEAPQKGKKSKGKKSKSDKKKDKAAPAKPEMELEFEGQEGASSEGDGDDEAIPLAAIPDKPSQERSLLNTNPAGNPKVTIAALVVWSLLFLGIIAMIVRKALLLS